MGADTLVAFFFLTLQFLFLFFQFNFELFNLQIYIQFYVLRFEPDSVFSIYVYFQLGICILFGFLFGDFPWYYLGDHDSIDLSLFAPVHESTADDPNE